ncbi:TIGR02466 family protein [bacterium]|nr:TIGR02466 family protein [bacterium]
MSHQLFVTSVFQQRILSARSRLFQDIVEESSQIRDFDEEGEAWSEENYPGGFTSYASRNDLFYMSSTFRELEHRIHPHATTFAEELGYEMEGRALVISDMWLNIMGTGCVHTGHIHPNSFISGTYYVAIPPGASAIRFEDPRLGLQMACPPRRENAPQEQQSFVSCSPKAGEIVLFESWLRHEVPPNLSENERISVSFNYHWEEEVSEEEIESDEESVPKR